LVSSHFISGLCSRALGCRIIISSPAILSAPYNWQKVQEMVGETSSSESSKDIHLKIKEPKNFKPPKEYLEATENIRAW
jgi:hypothetical protein